jgi:hypothetical protein
MAEPEHPFSRHLGSLAELGLSAEQLARLATSDAAGGVAALEAVGLEPTDGLRRLADGDPEQVAAYLARHTAAARASGVA